MVATSSVSPASVLRVNSRPTKWLLPLALVGICFGGLLGLTKHWALASCNSTDSVFCDLVARSTQGLETTPQNTSKAAPVDTLAAAATPTEPRVEEISAAPTTSAPVGAVAGAKGGIGVNVGKFNEWSSEFAFIDQFKRAQAWIPGCDAHLSARCAGFSNGASAWDTQEYSKIDIDANGWVRSLPAADDPAVKFTHVKAVLFHQDDRHRPAGRYIVKYDGQGDIRYEVAGRKVNGDSKPGRDVVEVSATLSEGLVIKIAATRSEDPIRNIRVIPPGGVCADAPKRWVSGPGDCRASAYKSLEDIDAPGRFHPRFLEDMSGYRAIRFLDWLHTNGNTSQKWSERSKPEDAIWTARLGSNRATQAHVPYEYLFDLANELKADAWINLPPRVDDDYAKRFAMLAKSRLRGPARLYLEYGNEPWNFAYPYGMDGEWFVAQARRRWPNNKSETHILKLNWYALRAAQLCRIVRSELNGSAISPSCVLNSQAANAEISSQLVMCTIAAAELNQPCSKEFDALAIAPYFGHEIMQSFSAAAPGSEKEMVDKIFQALQGGQNVPEEVSELARVRGWITASAKLAKQHGLALIAYEAGQNLVAREGQPKDSDTRALTAANRDPRMSAVYARSLNDWKGQGGELLLYYLATGAPSSSGAWGLKEGQFAKPTPKGDFVNASKAQPCWWKGC